LGTPGLFKAYLKGNVVLVAPGTGVVDDKAVYAYIPRIIKYYLGEDMILPNVKPIFVMKKKIENTLLKTFII
jgi:uncharacterized circularly permuted ATP-grasp superfamily protein